MIILWVECIRACLIYIVDVHVWIRQLLSDEDEKAVTYVAMVLHTCLDEAKVEELSEPQNILVALRVMELCRTTPDLDWA